MNLEVVTVSNVITNLHILLQKKEDGFGGASREARKVAPISAVDGRLIIYVTKYNLQPRIKHFMYNHTCL